MPDQNNGQNVGKIIEISGVVIDAVFTGPVARDLHRPSDRDARDGGVS